ALLESKDKTIRAAALAAIKETHLAALLKPLVARTTKEPDRTLQDATLAALSALDPLTRNPVLLDMLESGDATPSEPILDLIAVTPSTAVCDRIEKLVPRFEQNFPSALSRTFRLLSSFDA